MFCWETPDPPPHLPRPRSHWCCNTAGAAQEPPQEPDKVLNVSTWTRASIRRSCGVRQQEAGGGSFTLHGGGGGPLPPGGAGALPGLEGCLGRRFVHMKARNQGFSQENIAPQ